MSTIRFWPLPSLNTNGPTAEFVGSRLGGSKLLYGFRKNLNSGAKKTTICATVGEFRGLHSSTKTLNEDHRARKGPPTIPTGHSGQSAWVLQPADRGANYLRWRPRIIVWTVAVVSSFLQAWANRFAIDPDGVNYLDIAHAYFRGDWKIALNSYWSPLYSWVVGFVLHLFKPSLYWESTVLHLVNFAIFLLALRSFEFFLAALIRCQHATRSSGDPRAPLPEWVWWALGYPLFLISTLVMVPLSLSTPDLCVAALVYLAAGIVLRIRAGDLRWRNFAVLGGVLGIAYLAKAVMFPLAFAFLAPAATAPGKLRRAVPRTLLALIVFLLIGGPLVLALSRATGRLTFGDSGRIAYEVFVSRVEQPWRQGELTNAPGARHPLRRVLNAPPSMNSPRRLVAPIPRGTTHPTGATASPSVLT